MGAKRIKIDANLQLKKCAERYFSRDDDRISQLPDDILVDILSQLSLKEAARTSVLSSRWINLWKRTTSLDFEVDDRVLHMYFKLDESFNEERSKFVRRVNSVIKSHESLTLKVFKVRFPLTNLSRKSVTRWLEFAFSRQVQRLELDLENNSFEFPDYYFPKKLLTLSSCRASKVQPTSDIICIGRPRMLLYFKSLKALTLKSVRMSGGAIEFFIDNCPLLEQLTVHLCYNISSKLEICGPSLMLKHLELIGCHGLKSLKVYAPRLTTLAITRLEGLVLENVPMLVDVSVTECWLGSISMKHVCDVLSCCISQLQTLCLKRTPRCFMSESDELCVLREMPKLKKLVIEYHADGFENLVRLAALIRVSPYLEEFEVKFEWYAVPSEDREVKDAIVRSPHHHLKVFKFLGYHGSANEVELVSYILENCIFLEKMMIGPNLKQSAMEIAKQKLLPQVPQHVELVIL